VQVQAARHGQEPTSGKDEEDEVWHLQVTPQNFNAIVVKIIVVKISKCDIFGCKVYLRAIHELSHLPCHSDSVGSRAVMNATRIESIADLNKCRSLVDYLPSFRGVCVYLS
jgi:hypothetical protein